ncbi:MAG: aminotransferase class I/II-fold pyridoxal phosphate-dependent enzyme, partial [Candidatus Micrarchaeota archaeon]|nr:aminotransferase class I/II-fold pyridoxal phosphate-dependent enzyme [Candidatus Micrarchaeota archaeon]
VHRNLYGCSDSLLRNFLAQLGVEVRFVDMRDPKNVEKAIDGKTRAVYLESPSNPILDLVDIRAVANLVNDRCPVIVDNTFASLVTQNPFEQGAHIVIYSLTKSIGGESEGIGGAVLGSGPFIDQLFMARKDLGAILPAREAMTFVIGLRTLKMRYEKMQQNATQLAEMLKSHPAIEDVIYPLYDERYDELCKSGQMNGPGHVLIMDLKGGVDAARKFVDNLKLGKYAVSLGSHTLLSNPWTTTHAFVDRLLMAAMGLTPGQLRISAGKEFFADIWNDFEQAFKKAA